MLIVVPQEALVFTGSQSDKQRQFCSVDTVETAILNSRDFSPTDFDKSP
jgi:hypothetical protein